MHYMARHLRDKLLQCLHLKTVSKFVLKSYFISRNTISSYHILAVVSSSYRALLLVQDSFNDINDECKFVLKRLLKPICYTTGSTYVMKSKERCWGIKQHATTDEQLVALEWGCTLKKGEVTHRTTTGPWIEMCLAHRVMDRPKAMLQTKTLKRYSSKKLENGIKTRFLIRWWN